jgi:hypothetical protein
MEKPNRGDAENAEKVQEGMGVNAGSGGLAIARKRHNFALVAGWRAACAGTRHCLRVPKQYNIPAVRM